MNSVKSIAESIKELTKKESGFVKDYIKTGDKYKSALNNYDIKGKNPINIASAIAHENLEKPRIQKAIKSIADRIPDEDLLKKHKDLLKQRQLAYFVFPKKIKDEEIEGHLQANGLDLIVIRETEKGKMAFYSIDDPQAIKNGLEMAYKLKGLFIDRIGNPDGTPLRMTVFMPQKTNGNE